MKSLIGALAVSTALMLSMSARAEEGNPKAVWGGGPANSSAYTAVFVPKVIELLGEQHMSGYNWGGVSQGTIANAEAVTDHPTNLALGQLDIFTLIKDQPIPGRDAGTYQFTIVKPDISPECLYLVSKDKSYKTFGDVVGNGWQLGLVTGGEKSGSFGTWKVLESIYPDLKTMTVVHAVAISDIIEMVRQKDQTVGFFVMRPDPDSEVFKTIADADLTIVPVVDFDLESKYKFMSLKVSHGWSGSKSIETACTSVALITGDPKSQKLVSDSDKRRLAETINRMGAVDVASFRPTDNSWAGMWDSIVDFSTGEAQSLMEKSKSALNELRKKHGG